MNKRVLLFIALSSLTLVAPLQHALAGYTTTLSGAQPGETFYDGDISGTDLINVGVLSLASATQSSGPAAGTLDGAHDGSAAALNPNDYFFQSQQTLTFTLNLDPTSGGSATGYTLSKIQSIAGWGSAGFAAQSFSLYVTTLTDPVYTQIGTGFDNESGVVEDFSGNTPQATETLLTGDSAGIATNVTGIQFVYNVPASSGGTVLREVDVFGAPTAIPEPATNVMLLAGLGLLGMFVRRRAVAG